MDIADAAAYFNRDEVFDAYTDVLLFMAHTSPHDDHTSSGATSRRRTMTAEVDTAAPGRRAIRWYGTYWIVGGDNTDSFLGSEVRRNFGLKKSTGLVHVVTPGQAASGQTGAVSFHTHKEYYRDMTDALTSADMDVMYNVFCPLGEPVYKGSFLLDGDLILRVRGTYESTDEFRVAEADQLDVDARQVAIFTGPAALEFTAGASPNTVTVDVIQTDVSKAYRFRNEAESGSKPGDRIVFVAKSALTPVVGGHLRMLDANWRIITLDTEADAWILRARRI